MNDIYAAMALRGAEFVESSRGLVGAITSRAFVVGRDLRRYRTQLVTPTKASLRLFLDLGKDVLDAAFVETCCYVLGRSDTQIAAFQDLRHIPRSKLPAAVAESPSHFSSKELGYFAGLPQCELVYTLDEEREALLLAEKKLEPNVGRVTKGLSTCNDPRFVRLRWEVAPNRIGPVWHLLAKGGEFSWFTGDLHLVVNRAEGGRELAAFELQGNGNVARTRQSSRYYGCLAITFSRRSQKGFSARRLRRGAVFSDKSGVIVPAEQTAESAAWIAPMLASADYLGLIYSQAKFGSYETGAIKRLPAPTADLRAQLDTWLAVYRAVDVIDEADEISAIFVAPPDETYSAVTLQRGALQLVAEGLKSFGLELHTQVVDLLRASEPQLTARFGVPSARISWSVGVAFGRFDVRLLTGARQRPEPPDPFAELTAYAPGMLTDTYDAANYPLSIDSDGILVDDEDHSDDIVAHIEQVCRLIWKDRADTLIQEACELLKVKSLREYIRKSGKGGCWEDHVKRYSKSRRTAPIYWLLQSSKKSYAIWLYYHRIDGDTLFKILGPRYLGGKIARTKQAIAELRPEGKPSPGMTKKHAERLDDLDDELVELEEFEARLRAAAERKNENGEVVGFRPDRDDGVVLNAAPLHELIPWPTKKKRGGQAQSELTLYWQDLEAGRYDWSHVAMLYWPARVAEKCRTDMSLAVAHGLDRDLFPGVREELSRRADVSGSDEVDGGDDETQDEASQDEE